MSGLWMFVTISNKCPRHCPWPKILLQVCTHGVALDQVLLFWATIVTTCYIVTNAITYSLTHVTIPHITLPTLTLPYLTYITYIHPTLTLTYITLPHLTPPHRWSPYHTQYDSTMINLSRKAQTQHRMLVSGHKPGEKDSPQSAVSRGVRRKQWTV